MNLLPGEVIDRYEIETLLGEGGMAKVFRARHTGLGTLHAVKLLTSTTPHVRERLLLEGRVQASLKHDHIVAVHDIIDVDGAPGLVMEYVDGPTLQGLLAHGHLFSEAQLDAVALALFAAVEHAHGVQVVHRDLKPANVLLARHGEAILPKITDFGLAKLLSVDARDSATRSGVAMGTPAYMAPEQVRNAKYVGAEADLWSIGAVLFELVTQQRAFEGDDVYEIYRRVVEGDRPPVAELAQAPERMIRAIDAALVVDRHDRAASVAVLRDLWVDGMPDHDGPVWDAGELERIGALGHGGKPWSVSDTGSHEATGGSLGRSQRSESAETLVLGNTLPGPTPAPPPASTRPPPATSSDPVAPPSSAARRWGPSALVGGVVVALLAWTQWPDSPPSPPVPPPAPAAPAEAVQPVPAPVEPLPAEPVDNPVPAAPEPAALEPAAPEPAPAPRPKPPTPRPDPTPPAPVAQPAPVPPPPAPPADAPPATTVTVTGYDQVHLENVRTGDIAKPGPVDPGRWRVVAMFAGHPTPSEPFDIAAGQQVEVHCSEIMGVCQAR